MGEALYFKCSIKGDGRLTSGKNKKGVCFNILEMSAESVRIFSVSELDENTPVKVLIRLPSLLFQVVVRSKGILAEKLKAGDGYEYLIRFEGLPDKDKREIEDMLRSAAGYE